MFDDDDDDDDATSQEGSDKIMHEAITTPTSSGRPASNKSPSHHSRKVRAEKQYRYFDPSFLQMTTR